MIQDIGNEIAKMYGCLFMLAIAVIVVVGVCVFWLGRCTAQKDIHLQSPIVVKGASR